MSTKIFNGWRITGRTLENLLGPLKKFRAAVSKKAEDIIYAEIAYRTANAIDAVSFWGKRPVLLGDVDMTEPLHLRIMHEVDDDVRASFDSHQRTRMDIQCSVTLHPIRGAILLLLFDSTNGSVYTKQFKKLLGVSPYPYWDNADRPSNISEREWRKIGGQWDDALGSGVPAENGFVFECMSKDSRPLAYDIVKLVKALPSFEDRVKTLAEDVAVTRRARTLMRYGRPHNAESTENRNSRYLRAVFDAGRWCNSDQAGIRAVKLVMSSVASRIKPVIVKDDVAAPLLQYYRKKAANGDVHGR